MFRTVLVANRGEIACRVIATLQRLGIRSVAVYTDADRDALHVAARRRARSRIDSYLSIEAVVAAARATGADAIHPGYGFLSENADLARACEAAGIVFVGPGVKALEVMGDKIRAKEHVARRGRAGDPGLVVDRRRVPPTASGYPLLVKPSAGGGGKGMTVVERAEDLADALVGARRVAAAAFGDDTLLLERLVRTPRHIEVQLLADGYEHVIHLGERECSLQRRHQKVIEEAPSPLLDEATRQRIGEAACDVARSVGYVGAGTVEFLVSDEAPTEFFFMEMNTRLQVEHPVTELVTGLDLVEWQLRVAAGEPLTRAAGRRRPDRPRDRGARLRRGPRRASSCRPPAPCSCSTSRPARASASTARCGRAWRSGRPTTRCWPRSIAWAPDRADGDRAAGRARWRARRSSASAPTSSSCGRCWPTPTCGPAGSTPACSARLIPTADAPRPRRDRRSRRSRRALLRGTGRPARRLRGGSDGWRLGEPRPIRYEVGDVEVSVLGATVTRRRRRAGAGTARCAADPTRSTLELDGRRAPPAPRRRDGSVTWVGDQGSAFELRFRTRVERLADELAALTRGTRPVDPQVRSPMPGTVVSVEVATGDSVVAGQILLTIEAMKMEHRVVAPSDGIVTLTVRPTDQVALDHVVATITGHPDEGTPA